VSKLQWEDHPAMGLCAWHFTLPKDSLSSRQPPADSCERLLPPPTLPPVQ
jgi:hypothetical protein